MQATTPPQAPNAPQAPTPLTVTVVGADGKAQSLPIPRTSSEIEQLRIRRRELTDQLEFRHEGGGTTVRFVLTSHLRK